MGKFSWCTSDTRKSIPCVEDAYKDAPNTVYLLNPFGKPYKEEAYSGYGKFGGQDVFELVAEWNRDYLSADMIAKPKRSDWAKGPEGDRSFDMAVGYCRRLCEAIEDYARGSTDEYMKRQHGAFLGVLGDGSDWKRCLGVAIASSDERHVKLKYPIKIVEKPCSYEAAGISPDCPRQGCIYDNSVESIEDSVNKAFTKLEAAKEKHVGEKIDALCDFFWASHMEDVIVTEDKRGHLVAKDSEGNRWKDAEIYDFVLNECLGFEPDGKLQHGYGAISQELADTLKAHAKAYGVSIETPEITPIQYTLEYLNDAGDIISRDYFPTDDEAKQFAYALLDTYREEGSESVYGLCITDGSGLTVWEAEVSQPEMDAKLISECEETIETWMDALLEATGKSSLEELTSAEILSEIEEVKGTIDNESVWASVGDDLDVMHLDNIKTLEAYLEELEGLLGVDADSRDRASEREEGKKEPLASKIAQAEQIKQSTGQDLGEANERDNGGNFNERDSYN